MVMVRSLYGLNSCGVARRKISADILRDIYFVPSVDDPEFYRRQARNPNREY